ncbi:MAG: YfhO family protein [Chitinophagaceae bacterium]|nr:YfhO family protein [Chitinophagaceae bacterium]
MFYKFINSVSDKLIETNAADLIIASLLVVPFTGAGKAAPRQIQAVISKSPPGIPISPLHPIRSNTNVPENEREFIFSWSMYNKEIGTTREVPYPIRLNTTASFYKKGYRIQDSLYYSKAFLFTKNEADTARIQIFSFAPNRLTLHLHAQTPDTLVVLQNIYPHWKATVNGKIVPIIPEGETFISLPIHGGNNDIDLSFEPTFVRISLIVSLISFICLLLIWGYFSISQIRKNMRPN